VSALRPRWLAARPKPRRPPDRPAGSIDPILPEVIALTVDDRERLCRALAGVLEDHPTIRFAILFGPRASGRVTSMSDVDVAVMYQEVPDLLGVGPLSRAWSGPSRTR
jgi:hypothetical protein